MASSTIPTLGGETRECEGCGVIFRYIEHYRERFCTRTCYDEWRTANKKCPDCGHARCQKHAREKTARWRAAAPREELKAKSLQVAYRKAAGQQHTLTLAEARRLIANTPACPYCKLQIPWAELSIDHRVPQSRGGSNDPSNLVWTDLECNIIKGNLLEEEFLALMSFLEYFPEMRTILARRLKAGGFMYTRRKHQAIKYRD